MDQRNRLYLLFHFQHIEVRKLAAIINLNRKCFNNRLWTDAFKTLNGGLHKGI